MTFRIALFGATGAAGGGVLDACLKAPEVGSVLAVVRRPTGLTHEKLEELTCSNFADLSSLTDRLGGIDACFYCLGISATQVSGEKEYREITETYALAAAAALKTASPQHIFHFISGGSTNPKSRMMWARVKGETELALQAFGLAGIVCWRPGYIHPLAPRKNAGATEHIMRAVYPLFKGIESMSIPADDIGYAMIEAQLQGQKSGTHENAAIRDLARKYRARAK
jgi:uncharacterized protein YbjT (DUF2867 family)